MQQSQNSSIHTLAKLVCCICMSISILPHSVTGFYTIPMHPQTSTFKKDNLARSLLLEDKAWDPRLKVPDSKELYSGRSLDHQSRDARTLIQQAWILQTEAKNFSGSTMLYEEALKLDPQVARQTSMTLWAEAWGLENIRGYPGKVT
jgi:hypothetical protein